VELGTSRKVPHYLVSARGPILSGRAGRCNPVSHEPDKASARRTYHGLCQVLVQAQGSPGTATLFAESSGLLPAHLAIALEPAQALADAGQAAGARRVMQRQPSLVDNLL